MTKPTPAMNVGSNSIVGCCGGGLQRHEVCSHVKKYIQQEQVKAVIEELEAVLSIAEDIGVSDVERSEYHNGGNPLSAINPEMVAGRLAKLREQL
jgi:hypothetical protein